jgi:hypothetical protein
MVVARYLALLHLPVVVEVLDIPTQEEMAVLAAAARLYQQQQVGLAIPHLHLRHKGTMVAQAHPALNLAVVVVELLKTAQMQQIVWRGEAVMEQHLPSQEPL